MESLFEDPQNFIKLVRRYTASSASSIIYGQRAPTYESFWGHVSLGVASISSYRRAHTFLDCLRCHGNGKLNRAKVPRMLIHE